MSETVSKCKQQLLRKPWGGESSKKYFSPHHHVLRNCVFQNTILADFLLFVMISNCFLMVNNLFWPFHDILPRRWSSVVFCFRVHCVHFVLLTTVHKCVCKAQITYPLQVIGWPTSLKRYFVMKAWAVFMRLRFLFEVIIHQFGSLINENRIFAMRSSLVAQSSSIGSTPSFS